MSNERIDLTQFEESFGSLLGAVLDGTCTLEDGEGHLHDRMQVILTELKRCYDFIEGYCLDEDIEHKMVIDLRECSWECLHQLCVQAGVEDGTKEEMIARLLE